MTFKRFPLFLALLAATCGTPAQPPDTRFSKPGSAGVGLLTAADRDRLNHAEQILSGQTVIAGQSTAHVQIHDAFIWPDLLCNGVTTASDYGDDNTGALDRPDLPFRTLDGLRTRLAAAVRSGMRIAIHFGGDGVRPTANTWSEAVITGREVYIAPNDCRRAITSGFDFGEGAGFQSSWMLRGPRHMVVDGAPSTIVSVTDETYTQPPSDAHPSGQTVIDGRVVITFSGPVGGFFLRGVRSDGREITFPWPLDKVDLAAHKAWISNITASQITALAKPGDVWTGVYPGAMLHTEGQDGNFYGVAITGTPAYQPGNRLGGAVPQTLDANYESSIERMWLVRACISVTGAIAIENSVLDDQARVHGGELISRGNRVVQFLDIRGTDGRYLMANSQYTATLDPFGRMLSYALPLDTSQGTSADDPEYPLYGVDMVVGGPGPSPDSSSGGQIIMGGDVGGEGAHLRIESGLDIENPPDGVGIHMFGRSQLWIHPTNGGLWVAQSAADVAGIWAKDGSVAWIPGTRVKVLGGSNHLRVDRGAAIGLGSLTSSGRFLDSATWNGIFTRRLEKSGAGYPTDGISSISDNASLPGSYWRGF